MKTAPGIRVSAGSLKNRRLEAPAGIRPSEGKVKEALFSIWSAELPGAAFLDLFAGSGAVGIEAISRGALTCVFVERERRVLALLKKNLALVPAGSAEVLGAEVGVAVEALAGAGRKFDLLFADPPYAQAPDSILLRRFEPLLAKGGKIAVEHSSRVIVPLEAGELVRIETRKYGEAALSFYGKS